MKLYYFFLIVFSLNSVGSCNNATGNFMSIQAIETFKLPGIPSSKTLHFDNGRVFYASMDEPGKETFKCFSLQKNQLIWSVDINTMGINEGAITSYGDYVVPTLSDSIYLIDSAGRYRILKLEDRCKINPLVYKNTFILQDRGVGLKCFDAKTLQQLWMIKQSDNLTMSQPLLLNNNLIHVLDDKSIQSSDASTGNLIWRIPVADTFALYDLYGSYQELVFILSTNLKKEKQIIAINYKQARQVWQTKVDSTVNGLERDMVVNDQKLFCRGDSSIFTYSLNDGRILQQYNYKSRVVTNLVVDKNGNVLFGLSDNSLMKIGNNDKSAVAATFKSKLNQLYHVGDTIFLYSYPSLYIVSSSN